MKNRVRVVGLALTVAILVTAPLSRPSAQSADQVKASFDAHKGEFDFLLGDWEITLHNARGITHGFWSAVRLANDEVFDEYRLLADNGDTRLLLSTIRAYNPVLNQWELVNINEQSGLQEFGSGHWTANEMHLEQKVNQKVPDAIRRARYFDIQPDHFQWNSDLSTDGGKTWEANTAHIDAKRIGPARTIMLTSAKGPVPVKIP